MSESVDVDHARKRNCDNRSDTFYKKEFTFKQARRNVLNIYILNTIPTIAQQVILLKIIIIS